jgi:endonuclease/exonuclease/phosphatase family metal-dependent hydrolase/regulation of enolase protein 1 (concanavalin A-like superfamily)
VTKFTIRSFVATFFAVALAVGSASAGTLPSGWSTKDVGAVAAAGAATSVNNIFTVEGSGNDVWGTADEFRFVYRQLTGDGSVVSQVSAIDNVNSWVKAGVMMRETLNANSRHAFMLVSPGKGLAFQRRTSTGGSTSTTAASGSAPYYVKLSRSGNTFKAQKSVDGVTWTTVSSQSITMASTIYVGFAVSSHVDGSLASATFERTAVSTTPTSSDEPLAPAAGSAATIRVMHWNLHHGNDPNNKWAFPRQMEVIANAKPDIISLNEVEKYNSSYGNIDQAAEIAKYMTSKTGKTWYQYMVVASGASKGVGNAIISRFALNSKNLCQLSSSRNAVRAGMTVNGRTFNVWSAHLAVESGTYRVAEAKALVSCASGFAQQRLVLGDFNAGTGTTEINTMLASYIDGWAKAKSLGVTTNYSGNCDGCTRGSRIDYMFISKDASAVVIKQIQIIDTRNSSGVMASDHKPMVATFEVK